jgi:hypothetical protein
MHGRSDHTHANAPLQLYRRRACLTSRDRILRVVGLRALMRMLGESSPRSPGVPLRACPGERFRLGPLSLDALAGMI